jgi:hypothetical protein
LIKSFLRRAFVNFGIAKGSCHNKVAYATRTTSQQSTLAEEKHQTFYCLSCDLPVHDLFRIFFIFCQHLLNVFQSFCQILDGGALALVLDLQLVSPL